MLLGNTMDAQVGAILNIQQNILRKNENRHDALAYRESLGLQGIVEVYVKEANE